MAVFEDLGIIAVRFSPNSTNHRHITHVLMVDVKNGIPVIKTAQLMTRQNAVKLVVVNDVYTYTWNYRLKKWKKGAVVDTENVNNEIYLRTLPDEEERDNLLNLLNLDYFGK